MEYKQIRAVYDSSVIRVYQAYSPAIANEAIELGTFGKQFKLSRMTWIKPSFLWMMYRCGWASKEGQTKVLAIDIKREAFDKLVNEAIISHYNIDLGISYKEWERQVKYSNVRCQWDPERDIFGNRLDYRSLQLGIRGDAVCSYVNEWIVNITDITDYVRELNELRSIDVREVYSKLPVERVYIVGGYDESN